MQFVANIFTEKYPFKTYKLGKAELITQLITCMRKLMLLRNYFTYLKTLTENIFRENHLRTA